MKSKHTTKAISMSADGDTVSSPEVSSAMDKKSSVIANSNSTAESRLLSASVQQDHPSMYCPNCASRLESQRCKLMCRSCGYYMSCADYY
jgi:Zn finger protein HypA/HybF involved in hydrogenase expression